MFGLPPRPLAEQVAPIADLLEPFGPALQLAAASFLRINGERIESGIDEPLGSVRLVLEEFVDDRHELIEAARVASDVLDEQVAVWKEESDSPFFEPPLFFMVAQDIISDILFADVADATDWPFDDGLITWPDSEE